MSVLFTKLSTNGRSSRPLHTLSPEAVRHALRRRVRTQRGTHSRLPLNSSRSAGLASGEWKVGGVRALFVVSAAALWFGVASSLAAAGPVFTAWSAPVNLGSVVNSASMDYGLALSGDGLSLFFARTGKAPWVTPISG